jgi:hypothetical protein
MKTLETMTREELLEYCGHLKRMISNLQKQLTKALDTIVELRLARDATNET